MIKKKKISSPADVSAQAEFHHIICLSDKTHELNLLLNKVSVQPQIFSPDDIMNLAPMDMGGLYKNQVIYYFWEILHSDIVSPEKSDVQPRLELRIGDSLCTKSLSPLLVNSTDVTHFILFEHNTQRFSGWKLLLLLVYFIFSPKTKPALAKESSFSITHMIGRINELFKGLALDFTQTDTVEKELLRKITVMIASSSTNPLLYLSYLYGCISYQILSSSLSVYHMKSKKLFLEDFIPIFIEKSEGSNKELSYELKSFLENLHKDMFLSEEIETKEYPLAVYHGFAFLLAIDFRLNSQMKIFEILLETDQKNEKVMHFCNVLSGIAYIFNNFYCKLPLEGFKKLNPKIDKLKIKFEDLKKIKMMFVTLSSTLSEMILINAPLVNGNDLNFETTLNEYITQYLTNYAEFNIIPPVFSIQDLIELQKSLYHSSNSSSSILRNCLFNNESLCKGIKKLLNQINFSTDLEISQAAELFFTECFQEGFLKISLPKFVDMKIEIGQIRIGQIIKFLSKGYNVHLISPKNCIEAHAKTTLNSATSDIERIKKIKIELDSFEIVSEERKERDAHFPDYFNYYLEILRSRLHSGSQFISLLKYADVLENHYYIEFFINFVIEKELEREKEIKKYEENFVAIYNLYKGNSSKKFLVSLFQLACVNFTEKLKKETSPYYDKYFVIMEKAFNCPDKSKITYCIDCLKDLYKRLQSKEISLKYADYLNKLSIGKERSNYEMIIKQAFIMSGGEEKSIDVNSVLKSIQNDIKALKELQEIFKFAHSKCTFLSKESLEDIQSFLNTHFNFDSRLLYQVNDIPERFKNFKESLQLYQAVSESVAVKNYFEAIEKDNKEKPSLSEFKTVIEKMNETIAQKIYAISPTVSSTVGELIELFKGANNLPKEIDLLKKLCSYQKVSQGTNQSINWDKLREALNYCMGINNCINNFKSILNLKPIIYIGEEGNESSKQFYNKVASTLSYLQDELGIKKLTVEEFINKMQDITVNFSMMHSKIEKCWSIINNLSDNLELIQYLQAYDQNKLKELQTRTFESEENFLPHEIIEFLSDLATIFFRIIKKNSTITDLIDNKIKKFFFTEGRERIFNEFLERKITYRARLENLQETESKARVKTLEGHMEKIISKSEFILSRETTDIYSKYQLTCRYSDISKSLKGDSTTILNLSQLMELEETASQLYLYSKTLSEGVNLEEEKKEPAASLMNNTQESKKIFYGHCERLSKLLGGVRAILLKANSIIELSYDLEKEIIIKPTITEKHITWNEEKIKKAYEDCEASINTILREAYQKNPILSFFKPSQFSILIDLFALNKNLTKNKQMVNQLLDYAGLTLKPGVIENQDVWFSEKTDPMERFKEKIDKLAHYLKNEVIEKKNQLLPAAPRNKVLPISSLFLAIFYLDDNPNLASSSLLKCLYANSLEFPKYNQLLFCYQQTSWEEIFCFLSKALFNPKQGPYVLVCPERLSPSIARQASTFLQYSKEVKEALLEMPLAIICQKSDSILIEYLMQVRKTQKSEVVEKGQVEYVSKIQQLMGNDNYQNFSLIAHSEMAGQGKTRSINLNSKRAPLWLSFSGDCLNYETIFKEFKRAIATLSENSSGSSLAIKLYPVEDYYPIYSAVIQLLVYRYLSFHSELLVFPKDCAFYIEIANNEIEHKRLPFKDEQLFGRICEYIEYDFHEERAQIVLKALYFLEKNDVETKLNKSTLREINLDKIIYKDEKYIKLMNNYVFEVKNGYKIDKKMVSHRQLTKFFTFMSNMINLLIEMPSIKATIKSPNPKTALLKLLLFSARKLLLDSIEIKKVIDFEQKEPEEEILKIGKGKHSARTNYYQQDKICEKVTNQCIAFISKSGKIVILNKRSVIENSEFIEKFDGFNSHKECFGGNLIYAEKKDEIKSIEADTEIYKKYLKEIFSDGTAVSCIDQSDSNYVLTYDNFYKIIYIHLVMEYTNDPIILMGQTGCGKTATVKYMCQELKLAKLTEITIHAGYSSEELCDLIFQQAKIAKENDRQEMWLFLDELNTSPSMALLSEIISDRVLQGVEIPKNLKFIAACNPYVRVKLNVERKGLWYYKRSEESSNEFSDSMKRSYNNRADPMNLVYNVHPITATLQDYVWEFTEIGEVSERFYVEAILDRSEGNAPGFFYRKEEKKDNKEKNEIKETIITLILKSHQYFKINERRNQIFVSLRDIVRYKKLFLFFNLKLNLSYLESAIMASLFCYYYRISTSRGRSAYFELLSQVFLNKYTCGMLRDIINEVMKKFTSFDLPKGVVRSDSLVEILFAMIICLLTNVPLVVVGKPGCSKTMALNILQEQFKKIFSSIPGITQQKNMLFFMFLGSNSCKSEDIEKVFQRAEEHKKSNLLPVVVIDEVGVCEMSPFNPLKILHKKLDIHRELEISLEDNQSHVGFIGLTNWNLDAAKMNRVIHLAIVPPSESEFLHIAQEITFEKVTCEESRELIRLLASCCATCYHSDNSTEEMISEIEIFGMRDYFCTMKEIARSVTKDNVADIQHIIDIALKRNYSSSKMYEKIIACMNSRRYKSLERKFGLFEASLVSQNIIEKMYRQRFMLWVGDLQELFFIKSYSLSNINREFSSSIDSPMSPNKKIVFKVLSGSKFSQDQHNPQYISSFFKKITANMENGICTILVGLNEIYSHLYDLFNHQADQPNFCRIPFSKSYHPTITIHPNFNLISFMNYREYKNTPNPFLNRPEKHFLSVSDIFMKKSQIKIVKVIEDWVASILKPSSRDSNSNFMEHNIFVNYSHRMIKMIVIEESEKVSKFSMSQDDENQVIDQCKNRLIDVSTLDLPPICTMGSINDEEKDLIINKYYSQRDKTFLEQLYEATDLNPDQPRRLLYFTYEDICPGLEKSGSIINSPKISLIMLSSYMKGTQADLRHEIQSFMDNHTSSVLTIVINFPIGMQVLANIDEILLELDEKQTKVVCILIYLNRTAHCKLTKELYLKDYTMKMQDTIQRKVIEVCDLRNGFESMIEKKMDQLLNANFETMFGFSMSTMKLEKWREYSENKEAISLFKTEAIQKLKSAFTARKQAKDILKRICYTNVMHFSTIAHDVEDLLIKDLQKYLDNILYSINQQCALHAFFGKIPEYDEDKTQAARKCFLTKLKHLKINYDLDYKQEPSEASSIVPAFLLYNLNFPFSYMTYTSIQHQKALVGQRFSGDILKHIVGEAFSNIPAHLLNYFDDVLFKDLLKINLGINKIDLQNEKGEFVLNLIFSILKKCLTGSRFMANPESILVILKRTNLIKHLAFASQIFFSLTSAPSIELSPLKFGKGYENLFLDCVQNVISQFIISLAPTKKILSVFNENIALQQYSNKMKKLMIMAIVINPLSDEKIECWPLLQFWVDLTSLAPILSSTQSQKITQIAENFMANYKMKQLKSLCGEDVKKLFMAHIEELQKVHSANIVFINQINKISSDYRLMQVKAQCLSVIQISQLFSSDIFSSSSSKDEFQGVCYSFNLFKPFFINLLPDSMIASNMILPKEEIFKTEAAHQLNELINKKTLRKSMIEIDNEFLIYFFYYLALQEKMKIDLNQDEIKTHWIYATNYNPNMGSLREYLFILYFRLVMDAIFLNNSILNKGSDNIKKLNEILLSAEPLAMTMRFYFWKKEYKNYIKKVTPTASLNLSVTPATSSEKSTPNLPISKVSNPPKTSLNNPVSPPKKLEEEKSGTNVSFFSAILKFSEKGNLVVLDDSIYCINYFFPVYVKDSSSVAKLKQESKIVSIFGEFIHLFKHMKLINLNNDNNIIQLLIEKILSIENVYIRRLSFIIASINEFLLIRTHHKDSSDHRAGLKDLKIQIKNWKTQNTSEGEQRFKKAFSDIQAPELNEFFMGVLNNFFLARKPTIFSIERKSCVRTNENRYLHLMSAYAAGIVIASKGLKNPLSKLIFTISKKTGKLDYNNNFIEDYKKFGLINSSKSEKNIEILKKSIIGPKQDDQTTSMYKSNIIQLFIEFIFISTFSFFSAASSMSKEKIIEMLSTLGGNQDQLFERANNLAIRIMNLLQIGGFVKVESQSIDFIFASLMKFSEKLPSFESESDETIECGDFISFIDKIMFDKNEGELMLVEEYRKQRDDFLKSQYYYNYDELLTEQKVDSYLMHEIFFRICEKPNFEELKEYYNNSNTGELYPFVRILIDIQDYKYKISEISLLLPLSRFLSVAYQKYNFKLSRKQAEDKTLELESIPEEELHALANNKEEASFEIGGSSQSLRYCYTDFCKKLEKVLNELEENPKAKEEAKCLYNLREQFQLDKAMKISKYLYNSQYSKDTAPLLTAIKYLAKRQNDILENLISIAKKNQKESLAEITHVSFLSLTEEDIISFAYPTRDGFAKVCAYFLPEYKEHAKRIVYLLDRLETFILHGVLGKSLIDYNIESVNYVDPARCGLLQAEKLNLIVPQIAESLHAPQSNDVKKDLQDIEEVVRNLFEDSLLHKATTFEISPMNFGIDRPQKTLTLAEAKTLFHFFDYIINYIIIRGKKEVAPPMSLGQLFENISKFIDTSCAIYFRKFDIKYILIIYWLIEDYAFKLIKSEIEKDIKRNTEALMKLHRWSEFEIDIKDQEKIANWVKIEKNLLTSEIIAKPLLKAIKRLLVRNIIHHDYKLTSETAKNALNNPSLWYIDIPAKTEEGLLNTFIEPEEKKEFELTKDRANKSGIILKAGQSANNQPLSNLPYPAREFITNFCKNCPPDITVRILYKVQIKLSEQWDIKDLKASSSEGSDKIDNNSLENSPPRMVAEIPESFIMENQTLTNEEENPNAEGPFRG